MEPLRNWHKEKLGHDLWRFMSVWGHCGIMSLASSLLRAFLTFEELRAWRILWRFDALSQWKTTEHQCFGSFSFLAGTLASTSGRWDFKIENWWMIWVFKGFEIFAKRCGWSGGKVSYFWLKAVMPPCNHFARRQVTERFSRLTSQPSTFGTCMDYRAYDSNIITYHY